MNKTLAEGRYRLEETLGRGGMAVVYLGHDVELRRPVAVKVLAESLAGDESLRGRFLREARLAAGLSHPNIVRIYDAGETGGALFIVMEYVRGRTLAEVGKLPADEAVPLVLQACAGLEHAHEAGLIHRDVKPANLLLREDGVLKIADFGIARATEATRVTQLGTVLGTAAYLSPEQAAGDDVTQAADVYSLGAVLYELLTGRPPYEFASLADLAAKQSAGVITPVCDLEPTVPPALEATVMRCLARDPRFRPASAAALAGELAATTDVPTESLLATALTDPLQSRTYSSVPGAGGWIVITAAAAIAVVAVTLGLLRLGGGGTNPPSSPQPAQVPPPGHGATANVEARNLSAWLRAHSR